MGEMLKKGFYELINDTGKSFGQINTIMPLFQKNMHNIFLNYRGFT